MLSDSFAQTITPMQQALAFIRQQQQANGSFYSYSTTNPSSFTKARRYRTSFVPSWIALALHACPAATDITRGVASYLETQRKRHNWSFNYWDRHSVEARTMPYPDDLDDTSSAWQVLKLYKPEIFSGSVLAAIARNLIRCELAPGGPYRTWLVNDDAPDNWQDIDLAVNANVGGALTLLGVEVPGLTTYLEQAIDNAEIRSPYYPNSLVILYFIARWYKGTKCQKLRDLVQAQSADTAYFRP